MKKSTFVWLGAAVVLVLAIAYLSIGSVHWYTRLANLQTSVDARWAEVDKQYQHRAKAASDLAQKLSTEPGFDKSLLVDLVQAHDKVVAIKLDHASLNAEQFQQYAEAQGGLNIALAHVLMATLKSPALGTDKNFQTLRTEVIETENRIAIERNRFDATVQAYNAAVHHFPVMLEAMAFGFKPRQAFQADGTVVAIQSRSS